MKTAKKKAAAKKNGLADGLTKASRDSSVESHPKFKALQKQVATLLASKDQGIETNQAILRMKAEIKTLKAKETALGQSLEAAEKRNALAAAIKQASKPPKIPKPARGRAGDATAVLVLSDWHAEEVVESAVVNGLNEFNLDIANRRIERTFQKTVMLLEDARHLADIRTMVVALLGDFITGYIHPELEESNLLAPLPAIRFVKDRIIAGIDFLLQHADLEHITIPTCVGNHGRTTQRPRIKTSADNSFEQHLYYELSDIYRQRGERRVTFKIEPSYHNWLDIQGHACRFHHGEAIRYQGGVGGIAIPVNKAIAQWNKARRAAIDFFGHWHQFIPYGQWISNGSLIGYNDFTIFIKGDYEPPRQTFAIIDRAYGLTRALPIFCEEPR